LPLRTPAQAAASDISKSSHTPEAVVALLAEFQKECDQALLFLRFIAKVEVYIRPAGSSEPQLWYSCQVEQAAKLAPFRQMMSQLPVLSEIASHVQSGKSAAQQLQVTSVRSRTCRLEAVGVAVPGSVDQQQITKWLIAQGTVTECQRCFEHQPKSVVLRFHLFTFSSFSQY
jgi:hypothetical protein